MEPAKCLSIVEELHALTNRTDYVTMVKYLADSVSVPVERFEGSELSKMYYLDTSTCVMGKRKLKYNPMNLYSLFGQYCGKTGTEMKNAMLAKINKNYQWYQISGNVVYGMCQFDSLEQWLKHIKPKGIHGDELCIYALNVVLRRHTIVHTANQLWCTIKITPSMTPAIIHELCETHLLHLGNCVFGELR